LPASAPSLSVMPRRHPTGGLGAIRALSSRFNVAIRRGGSQSKGTGGGGGGGPRLSLRAPTLLGRPIDIPLAVRVSPGSHTCSHQSGAWRRLTLTGIPSRIPALSPCGLMTARGNSSACRLIARDIALADVARAVFNSGQKLPWIPRASSSVAARDRAPMLPDRERG
jgi:hypothetical protein